MTELWYSTLAADYPWPRLKRAEQDRLNLFMCYLSAQFSGRSLGQWRGLIDDCLHDVLRGRAVDAGTLATHRTTLCFLRAALEEVNDVKLR